MGRTRPHPRCPTNTAGAGGCPKPAYARCSSAPGPPPHAISSALSSRPLPLARLLVHLAVAAAAGALRLALVQRLQPGRLCGVVMREAVQGRPWCGNLE